MAAFTTLRLFFTSSPSYWFLSLVIAALTFPVIINFSRIKHKTMSNLKTGPQSLDLRPSDMAKIARALRKERDNCERQQYECRALGMDQDEINYWYQERLKIQDILNRIDPEI
jgi:hypothetical protein